MSPSNAEVFLVDDDKDFRALLGRRLKKAGHSTTEASTADGAVGIIHERQRAGLSFDVALLDGNLGDQYGETGGQKVAEEFRMAFPEKLVISISARLQPWSAFPDEVLLNTVEIARRVTAV